MTNRLPNSLRGARKCSLESSKPNGIMEIGFTEDHFIFVYFGDKVL